MDLIGIEPMTSSMPFTSTVVTSCKHEHRWQSKTLKSTLWHPKARSAPPATPSSRSTYPPALPEDTWCHWPFSRFTLARILRTFLGEMERRSATRETFLSSLIHTLGMTSSANSSATC